MNQIFITTKISQTLCILSQHRLVKRRTVQKQVNINYLISQTLSILSQQRFVKKHCT